MADDQCCGCKALSLSEEYDLALHVVAVVIMFVVSAAGALLPVVSKKVPLLSSRSSIIEWLMSFGFGVVIATGFIHMVNEGVEMLSNPCLGSVVEEYGSLGLAIVLATVLVMHLIECESTVYFLGTGSALLGGHGHSHGHGTVAVEIQANPTPQGDGHKHKPLAPGSTAPAEKALKRKLAVVLFEMGVVFHSVVVGIDLGVTSGMEFKTLLAAISFHQFFEGIAIGGSALNALDSTKHVMAMNVAYAVTTPLGLVVGIAIRSTYSDTSVTSLWVQGVANCVAGGIILYTGLVELMTYQMTTNREFLARTGHQRLALYVAFWLGAGLMALIGKWA